MAKSYSVALYTLSVSERRKDDSKKKLAEKIEGSYTFYAFVDEFLKKYKGDNFFVDKATDSYLRVADHTVISKDPYAVDGRFHSGDNGFSAILHDTKTKKEKKRNVHDAELIPLYFCVRATTDPTLAVLCTQRFGNTGIKTTLAKALQEAFNAKFKNHILTFQDHLPPFYTKEFFKANDVQKLEYTYMIDVKDAASLLEANGARDHASERARVVVSIIPQRGVKYKFTNGVQAIGDTLSKVKSKILNIDDGKKLETSVTLRNKEGRTRTFRTSQDRDVLPYIDVTDNVKKDDGGHPVFTDMRRVVEEILVAANLIKENGKD